MRQLLDLIALAPLLLAGRAGATLPADNGGVAVFAAGDIAPKFEVACANHSSAAPDANYSLTLGGKSSNALVPSSLVILSMQLGNGSAGSEADLFVQHMVTSDASLDAFIGSDAVGADSPGNTSYLWLANGPTDEAAAAATAALRARLAARALAASKPPARALARMHFAVQSTNNTGALADWLAQWTTPITSIAFPGVNSPGR
jgi:hypothetical protein